MKVIHSGHVLGRPMERTNGKWETWDKRTVINMEIGRGKMSLLQQKVKKGYTYQLTKNIYRLAAVLCIVEIFWMHQNE
jgi:hypothetical protein